MSLLRGWPVLAAVLGLGVGRGLPRGPEPLPPLPPRPGAPRPHIVLFVVDDFGWNSLGSHNPLPGATHTPHFDTAVAEGVLLERHYTFRWCAPTRSAFMTGRLPYHVLQGTNYVSGGMNMIAAKLQQVGYATHQVGKWHLGVAMQWMTPAGRGFDSSFGYLSGGEDHYTHTIGGAGFGCAGIDLFQTDSPAYTGNGTYGAFLYNDRVVSIIQNHNASAGPLFLYVATQDTHGPDQVPAQYSQLFNASFIPAYGVYNGMAAAADELFGNMTAALKARRMYATTLIVMSSDNGGPASVYTSSKAANNWPLRGGKKTDFEGGIRVSAFVSGGFLPVTARGTTKDGYIHCADWYPTMCELGGGNDCLDAAASTQRNVPTVDGYGMWPYLTGTNAESPRTEIMVGRCEHPTAHNIPNSTAQSNCTAALIVGDHKLIMGEQYYGFWQGPVYPNATTNHSVFDTGHHVDCGVGCVFDIRADPAETVDLAPANPALLASLRSRFFELNATQFDAPRVGLDSALCKAYRNAHGGYLGPYLAPAPPPAPLLGPFELRNSLSGRQAPELCLLATPGVPLVLGECSTASASSAVWYRGGDGPDGAALQTRGGDCLKIHEVLGEDCSSWTTVYLGSCRDDANSFALTANGTLLSEQCAGHCVAQTITRRIVLSKGCDPASSSTGGWSLVPPPPQQQPLDHQ